MPTPSPRGLRSMKLNPFKPNLGEEHTRKANKLGQLAEGLMSLPECWPHFTRILLLEIKTKQTQSINTARNGIKNAAFPLNGVTVGCWNILPSGERQDAPRTSQASQG